MAKGLAFSENGPGLKPLADIARKLNMIIIAGVPPDLNENLHIASFILYPDSNTEIYTKRYLHPGEEKYFEAGDLDHQIIFNGKVASLAICTDISNPWHPKGASGNGKFIFIKCFMFSKRI